MAIVKMSKFTLFTFQENDDRLLKNLQINKNIHFQNLTEESFSLSDNISEKISKNHVNEEINEVSETLTKLGFIVQKIAPFKEKEKLTKQRPEFSYEEFEKLALEYDYDSIFKALKAEDDEVKLLKSKINRLESENTSYSLWENLDTSTRDLSKLKFSSYILGTVNKNASQDLLLNLNEKFPNVYLENIGEGKDESYMLIIYDLEDSSNLLSFLRENGFSKATLEFSDTPTNLIENNKKLISEYNAKISLIETSTKAYVKELDKINLLLDFYESKIDRVKAKEKFLKTEKVFVYDGWLPESEKSKFEHTLNNVFEGNYYVEFKQVDKDDEEVPICLKNNKLFSAFENITKMYSYPKYNQIDPTPQFTLFYILFFGLMVGDLGYGLVLLIGTSLALKFLDLKEGARDFVTFGFYCSFGAIFAGIIYGSAFGVTFFAPLSIVVDGQTKAKAILDSNYDINLMMVLAVAIGVIQVIYGLTLKGYMYIKNGKVADAIYDSLFMITVILSVIGLLLSSMKIGPSIVGEISKWVLIASLIGLAATQGRENKTLAGKIGGGLFGVYGLTGYLGDFVSYTRLVALGLAGYYVAYSFNGIIAGLPNLAAKIVFGTLIFLISQSINFGLALLGAYVHSSRLQYVEFFGKFYDGGGVPFNPLKLKNNHIKIKD